MLTSPKATGGSTLSSTLILLSFGSPSASVVTFPPFPTRRSSDLISPATASITADGTSTQVITVQARDANDNNLTTGGAKVVISNAGGGILSGTTDNGNGTYTATLTSPTATGGATVSATVNGVAVS